MEALRLPSVTAFAPTALVDPDLAPKNSTSENSTPNNPAPKPDAAGAPPHRPPATPPRRRAGPLVWLRRRSVSFAWFLPVFAVGLVAQIVNIAGSPQRTAAEGAITAQAWVLDKLGELSQYGFLTDQAPLGWLQLAGYAKVTGAFERYDVAVLAGREFMVVVTMVSATLLWLLARRLHLSRPAASAALLLFTLAPLALQFHRSVSVENIATMWLLAALLLALSRRRQLVAFAGAAAAFGIAVLSAQTALLSLPLVAWLMWRTARPGTRRRSLSVAAGVLVVIGGGYALLVLLTGGFGASGSLSGSGDGSSVASVTWWRIDPIGIIAAGAAAVGALFMRWLRPFAVAALLLAAVLVWPGWPAGPSSVVLLIPFAALLIPGVVLSAATALLPRSTDTFPRQAIGVLLVGGTLAAGFLAAPLWTTQLRDLVVTDQDRPMRDAENWIAAGLTKDSRLMVDDSLRLDLARAGFALSPAGWRDSDYVVTTASLRTLTTAGDDVDQAIANSLVVATFGEGDGRVDIREVHPEGIDQANTDARSAATDRASAGAQLAANPNLTLQGDAAELLADGRVDSRIILSLGLLLGDRTATVAAFPLVAGESDTVRRQVLISASSTADVALDDWYRALGSPVAPSSVADTADGVLVTFPVGEPEALLPPAAP